MDTITQTLTSTWSEQDLAGFLAAFPPEMVSKALVSANLAAGGQIYPESSTALAATGPVTGKLAGTADLPESAKDLPASAKTLFVEAYNAAAERGEDEDGAREAGWAAVRAQFVEQDGRWLAKGADNTEPFTVEVAFKAVLPEHQITYGVVYPVYNHSQGERDLQKEWATPDVIEKAAHKFLADWRKQDVFHNEKEGYGTPVESYIAPCDLNEFHGHKLEQPIRKGSWVMATKWGDDAWKLVKAGKIRGYSIGGFKTVRR